MVATAFPNETTYGYIGNFENESNYEYRYGFTKGVHSVNPTAEVILNYANSYSDHNIVYDLAMGQAAKGVSFIMGSVSSVGNEGIYRAALELAKQGSPLYTSGLSVDQTAEENPYIIGGLLKNTGIAVNKIVTEFIEGNFSADITTLGLSDGGFGIVHITTDESNYHNETIITDSIITLGKKTLDDLLNERITFK